MEPLAVYDRPSTKTDKIERDALFIEPLGENFKERVSACCELTQEELDFLFRTIETLPDYRYKFIEDIVDSDDVGEVKLGAILIPELLKREVPLAEEDIHATFSHKNLDQLRDIMVELMTYENREVREFAIDAFRYHADYWKNHDETTYGWLEPYSGEELPRVHRSIFDEVQARSLARLAIAS